MRRVIKKSPPFPEQIRARRLRDTLQGISSAGRLPVEVKGITRHHHAQVFIAHP
jgi:hypothetical protein